MKTFKPIMFDSGNMITIFLGQILRQTRFCILGYWLISMGTFGRKKPAKVGWTNYYYVLPISEGGGKIVLSVSFYGVTENLWSLLKSKMMWQKKCLRNIVS